MTKALPLLLAALALAAGAVGLAGCGDAEASPGAAVVAEVGDAVVTLDDVAELYLDLLLQAGVDGDPAALDAAVDALVHRRLLIEEAYDGGVDETAGYRAARDLAETKALVDLYTAQVMADDLAVTDADLRRTFVQMNTTYDARHLYARDEAAARRLRRRVLAGEPFEAVAAETFADSALAASGGRVGPFGHDDMDAAFEAAAFRLPLGEVSEPVRTATGWSVIRVDGRVTNPLLTESEFDRKRDQIARYVGKRKRTDARFALSRAVRDDLAPRFEPAALDRLVAFATGAGPALDAEGRAEWRRTPLVRFDGEGGAGVWTVGDVEGRAASMTERQRAAVQDRASLQTFIEGLLVREEIAARARAAGLDDARVGRVVARRMEDWVFEDAKRRLRLQDDVPEDSLRAHFQAHRAGYVVPERVRASEVLVETRAEADRLAARLRGGADFAALAREHSLRPGAATAGGDLGAVGRDQLGRLAEPVFDAAPGALVGPVEVAGRYALVLRGEALPSRPMTYAEARPQVREALDVRFAQRRLEATLARLRDRYPVRIHRDALAPLLARL